MATFSACLQCFVNFSEAFQRFCRVTHAMTSHVFHNCESVLGFVLVCITICTMLRRSYWGSPRCGCALLWLEWGYLPAPPGLTVVLSCLFGLCYGLLCFLQFSLIWFQESLPYSVSFLFLLLPVGFGNKAYIPAGWTIFMFFTGFGFFLQCFHFLHAFNVWIGPYSPWRRRSEI